MTVEKHVERGLRDLLRGLALASGEYRNVLDVAVAIVAYLTSERIDVREIM